MNQATQVAQWSQQYGAPSNGPSQPPEWQKAQKALEAIHAAPKPSPGQQQKKQKTSESGEGASTGMDQQPPPPPPPPPHQQQQQQAYGANYNQYYGQQYNMYPGPGPGPQQYPPHYGYYGMQNGPRPPTHGPYGPGPGPGPMFRPGPAPNHGPSPGQYGAPNMYGPRGYGPMPRGVPPPPPHQQNQSETAENSESTSPDGSPTKLSPGIIKGSPQQQAMNYNMYGPPQNYKSKQSPGAGGIRFQLPKRNNMQQGNAFHNYTGNHYNMYKPQQQQQQPQPQQQQQQQQQSVSMPPTKSTGAARKSPAGLLSSSEPGLTADWSPPLKDYVSRAFASAGSDKQVKDEIESLLKEKLTSVFHSGRTLNWATEPLPVVTKQREKPTAAESAAQHSRIQQSMLQHANMLNNFKKERSSRWETPASSPRGKHGGPAVNRRPRSPPGFRRRSRSSSRSFSRSRSRSRSPGHSKSDRRRGRHWSESSSESLSDMSSGSSHRGYSSSRSSKGGRSRQSEQSHRTKGWQQNTPRKDQENVYQKKNKKRPNKQPGKNGMFYDEAVDCHKLQKRAARFAGTLDSKKQRTKPLTLQINNVKTNSDGDELDWGQFAIIGTCQDMEKGYLRLTSAPDASTVRPISVLRRALTMVKDKWQVKQDYHYVCEQLKSIRQDLTVQTIRNDFCVHVYETHARIAMEKGDHEEFNQCQTNLKLLYSEGMKGHEKEFLAYRILYYMFTKNGMDMTTALTQLKPDHREDPCIKHALNLRSAWALNDTHRFFRLYKEAPKMSGYLVDWFLERERTAAVGRYVKAYRPSIPVEFIQRELAFSSQKDSLDFLSGMGVILSRDAATVDCKASMGAIEAQ